MFVESAFRFFPAVNKKRDPLYPISYFLYAYTKVHLLIMLSIHQVINNTVVHGAMGWDQKSYKASVAVPPAPVRVPSQRPLVPSVTWSKVLNTSLSDGAFELWIPIMKIFRLIKNSEA